MLNDTTFIGYAIEAYKNRRCKTIGQFKEDVRVLSLIKKKMKDDFSDVTKTKIMLNLIMSAFNVFDHHACLVMLFYKVRQEHWYKLKTFLSYMGRMPNEISELNIRNTEIATCENISKNLSTI